MGTLSILGSTGSIGTNTLDVVRRNRHLYEVYALAAGRNASLLAGPHVTQWEWDRGQGFLTLLDDTDTCEVDVRAKYTLVLNDGTRCVPTLAHDYSRPLMKYRVQCSPKELLGLTLSAVTNGRSSSLPSYDTPRLPQ